MTVSNSPAYRLNPAHSVTVTSDEPTVSTNAADEIAVSISRVATDED